MFAKIKKNSLHPTKPQRKSNDQRVNVKTRERENKRDGEIRKPTTPPPPNLIFKLQDAISFIDLNPCWNIALWIFKPTERSKLKNLLFCLQTNWNWSFIFSFDNKKHIKEINNITTTHWDFVQVYLEYVCIILLDYTCNCFL